MRTTANQRRLPPASSFEDIAQTYLSLGWSPFPLPKGKKGNPPTGITGLYRRELIEADVLHMFSGFTSWVNIGLAMPRNVIGIDVDIYGDKHGGQTFKALIGRYGPIPNAPYSSSRSGTEGGIPAGIHFYRVPDGMKFVRGTGSGIDIIQWSHRYAVAWPSIHPEGRQYKWHGTTGPDHRIPSVGELPELPEPWLNGLASNKDDRDGIPFTGTIDEWFASLPDRPEPLNVRKFAAKTIRAFRYAGRYDTMVSAVATLVSWGAQGDPVEQSICDAGTAYEAAVGDERDASSEFIRALEGAIHRFGAK